MKYVCAVTLILTLTACGKVVPGPKGDTGAAASQGAQGSTGAQGPAGAPGTNGIDGTNGTNGAAGADGHSALVVELPSTTCANGGALLLMGIDLNDNHSLEGGEVTASADICNGAAGANGTNGSDGANGSNGTNGTNGVNGTNGADGHDAAPTAFTPVGIVDPCGTAPGVHNEVFIRLQNGTLLASFSDNINGYNTRFSVLTPGNYMTTDGDNCVFTVDAGGNISNENHHS